MKYILVYVLISISAISMCYAQATDSSAPSTLTQELEKALNEMSKLDSLNVAEKGFTGCEYYEDPPEPINPIAPEYPPEQLKTGIEGLVYLEVEVFKDGSVGKIKVVKSLHKEKGGLDEAAVNAVKKWKFIPGKSYGKPIDTVVIIPIEFILPQKKASTDNQKPSTLTQELEKAIAENKGKFVSSDVPENEEKVFSNPGVWEDPPEPINPVYPEYPPELLKTPIQGTVYLEVEVFKSGSVGKIKVVKSLQSGPGSLDEAAVKAVKKWKFIPAKRYGKPIDTRVIIPIEFTITHKDPIGNPPKFITTTDVEFKPYATPPQIIKSVEPLRPLHTDGYLTGFAYLEVEVYKNGDVGHIYVKNRCKVVPAVWMRLQLNAFGNGNSNPDWMEKATKSILR